MKPFTVCFQYHTVLTLTSPLQLARTPHHCTNYAQMLPYSRGPLFPLLGIVLGELLYIFQVFVQI